MEIVDTDVREPSGTSLHVAVGFARLPKPQPRRRGLIRLRGLLLERADWPLESHAQTTAFCAPQRGVAFAGTPQRVPQASRPAGASAYLPQTR